MRVSNVSTGGRGGGGVNLSNQGLRESADMDSLYTDRALLVLLVAVLADERDLPVERLIDEGQPDWPVIAVQLPTGQVSWHLNPADLEGVWRVNALPIGTWDGHTTAEKMERIRAFVRGDDILGAARNETMP